MQITGVLHVNIYIAIEQTGRYVEAGDLQGIYQ